MLARTRAFLHDLWGLTKPYWQSEERWRSGVLLTVIVGLQLGSVWLTVIFNAWYNLFYNSLQDKDFGAFQHQLLRFCYIAAAFIIVSVYQTYLQQMLRIRWRRWLTDRYIGRWTAHRSYYRLQIAGSGTDNPDQRIAQDIDGYIGSTLALSLGLLNAVVTLASFTLILWNLSGSIAVWGVEIHGYMLWVAIAYAIAGTALVHLIGRPLIGLNFRQQQYEANFRYALVRLRENAEGVALYGGEAREAHGLAQRFADVLGNWWGIMRQQKRLNWFSYGYSQAAVVFPFLVASPRYFSGAIQLGGLVQISSAFGRVQESLSWFVGVYADVAQWKATVDRLTTFEKSLEAIAREGQGEVVRGLSPAGSGVSIEGLNLWLPDGTHLLRDLSIDLPPGSRTLVTGPSGSGKSTLFRTLGGLWPYASGTLLFPSGERLLFLPQKPYVPIAPLRAAVAYPDAPETYGDERIRAALEDCGLHDLAGRLDEEQHWAQLLSGGEQQRLAFARALLIQPRWLFMDEATSSLDEPSEAALYRLMVERLPGTALVSIAHRPTLAAFHDRKLTFAGNGASATLLPAAAE